MTTATITTPTPRNPGQGYKLETLEPVEGKTRFAKTQNHNGQNCTEGEAIAAALRELSMAQVEQAPRLRQEAKVKLFGWTRTAHGVKRVERGYAVGVVELVAGQKGGRSGRFTKSDGLEAGAKIDALFLNPSYEATDSDLVAAFEAMVEQTPELRGEYLRAAQDAFCIVLCRRAGIVKTASELPPLGAAH